MACGGGCNRATAVAVAAAIVATKTAAPEPGAYVKFDVLVFGWIVGEEK